MKLQMKFTVSLLISGFLVLLVTVFLAYKISESEAKTNAYNTCYKILASVEASRSYVRETLRPTIKKNVEKGNFIPEAMSASFVARKQFESFLKEYPHYQVKFASIHPRNPVNQADILETEIIERFEKNPDLKKWQGVTHRNREKFYTVAKPFRFKKSCMLCHSEPENAPQAVVEKYGSQNGFYRQVGDVTMYSISVPIEVTHSQIRRHVSLLSSPIALLIVLILLISSQLFKQKISKPIANFSEGITKLSNENYQAEIDEKASGELKELATAFNTMAAKLLESNENRKQAEDNLQKAHDLLEQKIEKRTAALRSSEIKFSKAFHNAPLFMSISSIEDGRFLDVNDAFVKITGYRREDAIGSTSTELGLVNKIDRDESILKIKTEGSVNDLELELNHADGSIINFLFSSEPIEIDGQMRLLSIANDITERKQMEERLRQAQKMESIGNLAGGIAHDFNNILFPIVGMSELLLEDLSEESPEYENAQEILTAGKRGRELVKQILAFSRQSERKFIPIRIQRVLRDALRLCRASIPTDIEIKQDLQDDCGMVMSDPTQMHQVAMNLITNAYHAIDPCKGKVKVTLNEIFLDKGELADPTLKAGRYAQLTVSDTGRGIDPQIIERIFEPYFTTKAKGKGTGLGLAAVHGIIKEHGGDIRVHSELGKGSTFTVYIPMIEKTISEIADQKAEIITGRGEKILLVDDEEPVLRLEKQMLERLGYKVTVRNSSTDALQCFRSNSESFDMVISDMTMPNMTGDLLSKKILEIKPDIPIVICTGFSDRIDETQIETIGVKGLLMKPVVKSDMAIMLRNVLDSGN